VLLKPIAHCWLTPRLAGCIDALLRHRKRDRELGHGFGFTTTKLTPALSLKLAMGCSCCPKEEVERLMGCKIDCDQPRTVALGIPEQYVCIEQTGTEFHQSRGAGFYDSPFCT
jgi:hypothetical protein